MLLGGLVSVSLACSALAFVAPGVLAGAWGSVSGSVPSAPVAATQSYHGPVAAPVSMGPTPSPTATPIGPTTPITSAQAGEAPASVPGASRLATRAEAAASPRRAVLAAQPFTVKLMSYNVLGSTHTTARGDEPSYGPGTERAHWAAEVIRTYAPDLFGTQETEFDQLTVLQAELPNYTFWPGNASNEPAVRTNLAFDNTRFSMVASGYITVQFVGLKRTDPYLQLQDKKTGRKFWFFNVHNSPNRHAAGTFAAERRAQLTAEVKVVNQLAQSAPVLMTGDFNDHDYTYCRLTSATALRAAQGGGVSPCRLPAWHAIDWIFGTRVSSWTNVHRDRGPLVARSTDHHIFVATATVN